MGRLSISLFGTFVVTLDGVPQTAFDSDKARALLAYLAVECRQPQRREKLAGLFWPEMDESHARRSLNQALYNLRRVLGPGGDPGPYQVTTPQTVQFNAASDNRLDIRLFTGLLADCHSHSHRRLEACQPCASRLDQAVDLYRGDFLEGFSLPGCQAFEEWALVTRERLRCQVVEALAHVSSYHEARGEWAQALGYARGLVSLDPLGEAGHRQLMRLLALDGQRDAALAQYHSCRALLEAELGVEPDRHTRALYERLRTEADGADLAGDLPAHLTPFVGRGPELVELRALLRDDGCRLVTVLGPGGGRQDPPGFAGCPRPALRFPRWRLFRAPLRPQFPGGHAPCCGRRARLHLP